MRIYVRVCSIYSCGGSIIILQYNENVQLLWTIAIFPFLSVALFFVFSIRLVHLKCMEHNAIDRQATLFLLEWNLNNFVVTLEYIGITGPPKNGYLSACIVLPPNAERTFLCLSSRSVATIRNINDLVGFLIHFDFSFALFLHSIRVIGVNVRSVYFAVSSVIHLYIHFECFFWVIISFVVFLSLFPYSLLLF